MNTGTIKNVLDAVRDWVNNKEQAYKPGEIYETVPDEIIKMLWDGDVVFGDLVPVSGARGLYPVDPVTNYLHFLEIFYGREEAIEMIKQNALTFTNTGDNAVSFKFYSENNVDLPTLYVVDDEEGLVELKINETYTIPVGGSIKIVGNNPKGNIGVDCTRGFADWSGDTTIKVSGKLTSLIDVMGMTDVIPSTADFSKLFHSAPITDAAELVLPNNVAPNCYEQMFSRCTSMVSAPELPATILADFCYAYMFQYCENLNYIKCSAVDISADNCTLDWVDGVSDNGIFSKPMAATDYVIGTSGIPYNWEIDDYDGRKYLGFSFIEETTDKPIMVGIEKQTSIVDGDPYNIEYSYDKINWTTLIDSDSADGVYWPKKPSENYSAIYFRGNNKNQFNKCYNDEQDYVGFVYEQNPLLNVFGDITTLLRPEGKVKDLSSWFTKQSYEETEGEPIIRPSFDGILGQNSEYGVYKKLQHAKDLLLYPKILSEYCYGCYNGMFYDCSALTTAPELPATTLADGCYKYMFQGCTSLTQAPELPATTLASNCYNSMFSDCTGLTVAPELTATTLADYCYNNMFSNCTSLTTAPELAATILSSNCYNGMLRYCTSLTEAPKLPATALADYCYDGMFYNCTSLTTAPELPATILANYCYDGMFRNCTSLTTAPELSATTLADGCYYQMFQDCTSLTTAPELPATTLASDCYSMMFYNCTSLTTAPALPATKLASNCYQWMFGYCKGLTAAPELPATKLASNCYQWMFGYCTSLTTAPELPATTLADYCYSGMFGYCTSLTTAPELPVTTLASNCYQWMFGYCTSLTTAPELPATKLASNCYQWMFGYCTSLTTAPELPATTLADVCYNNMFYRCTSLTVAPELPATKLASNCYSNMFRNCSSLNHIKCLAVNGINTNNSTLNWVSGVPRPGTFVKASSASWPTGNSGIPSGWTIENI